MFLELNEAKEKHFADNIASVLATMKYVEYVFL